MINLLMEIQQLQADLIVALAALMVFPQTKPLMLVVNLFALEEPSQTSHRKRHCIDENPNLVRLQAWLIVE